MVLTGLELRNECGSGDGEGATEKRRTLVKVEGFSAVGVFLREWKALKGGINAPLVHSYVLRNASGQHSASRYFCLALCFIGRALQDLRRTQKAS